MTTPSSTNPHAAPDPDEIAALLTQVEAAKTLRVTERTVRSLITSGKLRAVRFGRNVRIDPVDLRRFIDDAKKAKGGGGAA